MEAQEPSYTMTDLKCPSCGAPLEDISSDIFTCAFCGSTIRVRRREVADDGTIAVCDGVGQPLLHVRVPFGWRVESAEKEYSAMGGSYPVCVRAILSGEGKEFIQYRSGEAFSDTDAAMYRGNPSGIVLNIRPFQTPAAYLDAMVTSLISDNVEHLEFIDERPLPLMEPLDRQEGLRRITVLANNEIAIQSTASMGFRLDDVFFDGCTRVYRAIIDGESYLLALATCVEGFKVTPVVSGMGGVGGFDLGGLFGSLFGGKRSAANNAQSSESEPFGQRNRRGMYRQVIEWRSRHLFTLQAPEDAFEYAYETAFTDFCSTLQVDSSILAESEARHNNDILRAQAATRAHIDQQNQAFQAYQQAHATQVAAFDSYNQAWWNRTNSSDAARHNSYQSRLASEDRMRERYSEAIRGVNTYVRTDGSELELSVASDAAWQSDQGTVIGTSRGYDPGAGWTQLQHKE